MNHGVRRREVEVADSSELLLNDKPNGRYDIDPCLLAAVDIFINT